MEGATAAGAGGERSAAGRMAGRAAALRTSAVLAVVLLGGCGSFAHHVGFLTSGRWGGRVEPLGGVAFDARVASGAGETPLALAWLVDLPLSLALDLALLPVVLPVAIAREEERAEVAHHGLVQTRDRQRRAAWARTAGLELLAELSGDDDLGPALRERTGALAREGLDRVELEEVFDLRAAARATGDEAAVAAALTGGAWSTSAVRRAWWAAGGGDRATLVERYRAFGGDDPSSRRRERRPR